MSIFLRGLRLFIVCFLLAAVPAISGAQDTAMPDTAVPDTAVPDTSASDTAADVSRIDIDDPAIREAFEAKQKAERELAAAIEAQLAVESQSNAVAETEAGPSLLSFIPSTTEQWRDLGQTVLAKLQSWLTSPTFLMQVGAIVVIFLLAGLLARIFRKRIPVFKAAPAETAKLRNVRDILYRSRHFLRAVLLVAGLAAVGAALPQNWLIKLAQGLAVVFLLYRVIKTFITNEVLQKLATWILIPLALLMVFGFYDDLTASLNAMKMGEGENALSAMTLIRLAIFGAIFWRLGTISNVRGQDAIRNQEGLDITTREVVAKIFQIIIFAAVGILALTAAGISLSGLVVIFSALSLGIGLGLQPVAANFVSGMIILFDRSVKVGDFVNMEGDQFGRVKAINMRSTTVATADGKDIIVPNTSFTENAYENWTHDSPLQRYEVDFGVAYDTDLDALVPLIRDAVLAHEDVLAEPDVPSVEFRAFGDSSINMCVEFWAEGIDDGPNKFTSDVGFIIWRTLKANNIEIPFPQRVIYSKKA